MTTPSVSVVIPTYRRRDRLPTILQPLLASPALEVVVVVDGAADGSLELLQDLAREHAQLVPVWRENGGEGAARQTGVERATGEVVLILDDDVVASSGLVEGHAAHHARQRDLLVLGYMPTGLPQRRRPGQFATYLYAAEYEQAAQRWESGEHDVLDHLWAGNMSLRREDALRVDLRSPDFGAFYHVDQDFGRRCRAAGLHGLFDRSLRAQHVHERPLPAFVRDARSQGVGRVRMAAQHRLGALPDDAALLEGVPGPVRALASPRVLPVAAAALQQVTGLAGRARAWPVETASAKLLRRLEQVRGARQERARTPGAPVSA